jgi:hypothetical protein
MDNSHPPHGLVMFSNARFSRTQSRVKMILNHGHVGVGVSLLLFGIGAVGGCIFNKALLYICKVFV